jgi:hypothetical protein
VRAVGIAVRVVVLGVLGCGKSDERPEQAAPPVQAICAEEHAPSCRGRLVETLNLNRQRREYQAYQRCSDDRTRLIYCEDADGDGCLEAVFAPCGRPGRCTEPPESMASCDHADGGPALGATGVLAPGGAIPADVAFDADLRELPVRDGIMVVVFKGRGLRLDETAIATLSVGNWKTTVTQPWAPTVEPGDGYLYMAVEVVLATPKIPETATLSTSLSARGIASSSNWTLPIRPR